MDEKLEQYRERFDDSFPLMCTMGMSDESIIELIDRCLKSGEPYEPDTEGGILY